MKSWIICLAMAALLGCNGRPAGPQPPGGAASSTSSVASAPAPSGATPPRASAIAVGGSGALPPGASFGDLVALLRGAGSPVARKPSDCLLGGAQGPAAPARIGAPSRPVAGAVAVESPAIAKLRSERPSLTVGLWTPHGGAKTLPGAKADLWLATLTPVTPSFALASPIAILWVTGETAWLTLILSHGTIAGDSWVRLEGVELDRFQRKVVPRAKAIAVTADRGTPLHRVHTVLGWLAAAKGEVAFAATVKPPAAPPEPPADTLAEVDRRSPPAGLCPLGISDVPPGKTPGDMGLAVFRAQERFQSALRKACASRLPVDSPGGEISISMRVLANGTVSEACVQRDYIGAEPLRDCLRSQARSFTFPTLSQGDFVNVALGVELTPRAGRIRPLCD